MMDKFISEVEKTIPQNDDTYVGKDGLLYCKKCGEPRETIINVPLRGERKVKCCCSCMMAERRTFEDHMKQEELDRRRSICFGPALKLKETRFEKCEENEVMKIAKNYADNFLDFYKEGKGLLLHGPVGSGKSSAAACIANQLLDQGYRVHMTDFSTAANKIQSTFDGKQEYINELCKYSLLIIDDLGIERQSEYMQEIVYSIINARYQSEKPLIITTNLDINEVKKIEDRGKGRVYDRILERCHPVLVDGQSYRRKKIREDFVQTEMRLKGESNA